ncbi:hypothetical protein ESCO_001548 [Escovopsis weberi]|uniref:Uncharacterized protein n=1 Tax=Escovopsis weberi TaxID=150374 RepID=A0A0M8MZ76_ESCWE|nr:hypothetical protein ESCO_001548 [Escovopsis weberi]
MATPLVAAIYALVAQARGTVNPAAATTMLLNVSCLAFNDTEHRVASHAFTISNEGDEGRRLQDHDRTNTFFNFSLSPRTKTTAPWTPPPCPTATSRSTPRSASARLKFATVEVSATDPIGVDARRLAVWSGFIAINGSDCTALALPYMGAAGSVREHTVVSATRGAWVSVTTDPDASPVHALGARDAATVIGQLFTFPARVVPRGRLPTSWDGQLDSGKFAPPGRDRVLFRALAILGDPDSEADWYESQTGAFSIRYE